MIPLSKKARLKRIKERLAALRAQKGDEARCETIERKPRSRGMGPKLAH